jgi:glycosyltransferase involved in cell wall biosynthesis
MKVIQFGLADVEGGAARAAYRLHCALNLIGVESEMWVRKRFTTDPTVIECCPRSDLFRWRRRLDKLILGLQKSPNPVIHSLNFIPTKLPQNFNSSEADLIQLNWIGAEAIAIEDLAKIKKPILMRLADPWAICGAEHFPYWDEQSIAEPRHQVGYYAHNRPAAHTGVDLDRWVWHRKLKVWQGLSLNIVTQSQWLADEVKRSPILGDKSISVIPAPLNLDTYQVIPKQEARHRLGLPEDKKLLLFGAQSSTTDPRKGFDLLTETIHHLEGLIPIDELELVVFGNAQAHRPLATPLKIHPRGIIKDEQILNLLYSAADVKVVPSRQENFVLTAVESLACGTPVAAFATGGIFDIVDHQKTGYLAQPFDTEELAQGIFWLLADPARHQRLCQKSRLKAEQDFDHLKVAQAYRALYSGILEN